MDGEDCRVHVIPEEIEMPPEGMKDYGQPTGKIKERFLVLADGRVVIKTKT